MNIHYHNIWSPTVSVIYKLDVSVVLLVLKLTEFAKALNVPVERVLIIDHYVDNKIVYILEASLTEAEFNSVDTSNFKLLKDEDVAKFTFSK